MLFRSKKYQLFILFTLLLAAFFVVNIKPASAYFDPAVTYSKTTSGQLSADEWNNLQVDFMHAWGNTTAVGGIGIGVAPQGTDFNGLVASSTIKANGGFLGSLSAMHVSSGSFGALAGGGNYIFPSSVGIGIGATPVNAGLHLASSTAYSSIIRLTNTGTSGGDYFMGTTNTGWDVGGNKLIFGVGTPSSANVKMLMDANGNVGIGTASPDKLLTISGASAYAHIDGLNAVMQIDRASTSNLGYTTYQTNNTDRWRVGMSNEFGEDFVFNKGASNLDAKMLIDYETGNVGIGTTAPSQRLEVAGNIFMNTGYLMQTDTWGMKWKFAGNSDTVEMNSSETAWKFNIAGGGVTKYRFNSSKTGFGPILDLNTSGSSIFYGNVGIGTTTPLSTLDVNGLIKMRNVTITQPEDVITKGYLDSSLSSTTANIVTQIATSSLWQGSLTGAIYNNNSGNVGIGTTNPQEKLDVVGNIKSTGTVKAYDTASGYLFSLAPGGNGPRLQLGTLASPSSYFEIGAWGSINNFDSKTRDLKLFNAGGSIFLQNSSGNVGIGTTTPGSLLSVGNNLGLTAGGAIYGATSTRYLDLTGVLGDSLAVTGNLHSTAGELKIDGTGNSYVMGNLGIGTTNPTLGRVQIDTAASSTWLYLENASEKEFYTKFFNNGTQNGSLTPFTKIAMGHSAFGDNASINFYRGGGTSGGFLAFTTNNDTERMRIDASGNVGIGTTTPGAKLDVNGVLRLSSASGYADISSANTGSIYFQPANGLTYFNGVGKNNRFFAYDYTVDSSTYLGLSAHQLYLQTAGVQKVSINDSGNSFFNGGNVGIGSTTPNFKFVVNGDASFSGYQIHNVGAPATGTDVANRNYVDSVIAPAATTTVGLQSGFWTTGAGSSIYNNNTGNVGIGTTAPDSKFDVRGGVNITGSLNFSEGIRLHAVGGLSSVWFNAVNSSGYDPGMFGITADSTGMRFRYGSGASPSDLVNILNNGNVGIGTTTPNSALDIFGKAKITNNGIIFNTDSSRWLDMTGANADSLRVSGNLITTDGKVGIGTTAPNEQLEITKNFRLPATSGTTPYGIIYKDGTRFIHDFNYGLNGNGITTAGGNTFVGLGAGNFTMGSTATSAGEASYNTGIGYQSLRSNTTGSFNTANGMYSLSSNTTGSFNTANGSYSLNSNTTGYYNTANGYQSLFYNTTGSQNTANGMRSLISNTTGYNNTANGYASLYSNTTGNNNTALGLDSGRYIANGTTGRSTGNNGLYLGYNSKASADGTDNEIVIGYNAIGKGSSTATYGNSSMLKHIFEAGNVGIGTTAPGNKLTISNGVTNVFTKIDANSIKFTRASDGADRGLINFNGAETLTLDSNAANGVIKFLTDGRFAMTVFSNQNIGIGTTTPAQKLEVSGGNIFINDAVIGSSTPHAAITKTYLDSALNGVFSAIDIAQYWKLNGNNLYASSTAWNVGIGTNTAAYKLDINGTFRATASSSSILLNDDGDVMIGI